MKQTCQFALAFIGLNAMFALNDTGLLARTPETLGVGDLGSLTTGLSPNAQGAFPYVTARGQRLSESRFSADLSLGTSRPASYGDRSTWLSRYLGSNGYRPRFDAQHALRKGVRVRLVVTAAPQPLCYWTPTFSPFLGHAIWAAQSIGGCQAATGHSRALLQAFTFLDDDAKKLVRESMTRSEYYALEWAAKAVDRDRRTPDYKFIVVPDNDLDGHEVDLDSF